MSSIVIALPKIEDARKIRSVLERHGFAPLYVVLLLMLFPVLLNLEVAC